MDVGLAHRAVGCPRRDPAQRSLAFGKIMYDHDQTVSTAKILPEYSSTIPFSSSVVEAFCDLVVLRAFVEPRE